LVLFLPPPPPGRISNGALFLFLRRAGFVMVLFVSLFRPGQEWGTVDPDKFHIRTNGGRKFSLKEAAEFGSYKTLLWDCPLVDVENETLESTFTNFKSAFPDGFAWEVLEVFSGKGRGILFFSHLSLICIFNAPKGRNWNRR
jgi:hypothetical protein